MIRRQVHLSAARKIQPVLITADMSLVTGLNYKRGVASAHSRQAKISIKIRPGCTRPAISSHFGSCRLCRRLLTNSRIKSPTSKPTTLAADELAFLVISRIMPGLSATLFRRELEWLQRDFIKRPKTHPAATNIPSVGQGRVRTW